MRMILLVAAAAATCAASPAYAATDAECQAMWTKADVNKDGVLSDAEACAMPRQCACTTRSSPPTESSTRRRSWKPARPTSTRRGKADAGAPLKGANSFTEGQAKDRALSHGLTDVGALKKDDDGVWRGSAKQDGKPVEVAVDFKGNVVPQATR